jgi:hypothetical protein
MLVTICYVELRKPVFPDVIICLWQGGYAHGMTHWVLIHFTCCCPFSDAFVMSFERPAKTIGTCPAVHSEYECFGLAGGMGCTCHSPVSSPSFYMLLPIFWCLCDVVQTSRKDDRNASSGSFRIWMFWFSWGMGCTSHNSVSSPCFAYSYALSNTFLMSFKGPANTTGTHLLFYM